MRIYTHAYKILHAPRRNLGLGAVFRLEDDRYCKSPNTTGGTAIMSPAIPTIAPVSSTMGTVYGVVK